MSININVCDIKYEAESETLSMLFEDSNDCFDFIKDSLINAVKKRIVHHEALLHECLGHYARTTYYTSIINNYIRLLSALKYTYTINDLNDIDYMNVVKRVVYVKQ